eukprot:13165092-Heterocapsa_arctica.AAC.1
MASRKELLDRGCHPETLEEKERRDPFWSPKRRVDYVAWKKTEEDIRQISGNLAAKVGNVVPAPPPGKPGGAQGDPQVPQRAKTAAQVDKDNM